MQGLYYLGSENKGTDQLCGNLALFSHMQKAGFLMMSSFRFTTLLLTLVSASFFKKLFYLYNSFAFKKKCLFDELEKNDVFFLPSDSV